jgi:ABC-2 type transport system ATP-binding protein
VRKGRPGELKAEVGSPTLFVDVAEIHAAPAGEVLRRFGELRPTAEGTLGVGLTEGAGAVSQVVRALDDAGIHVSHLELREPSLDDVFAEATGYRLEGADQ